MSFCSWISYKELTQKTINQNIKHVFTGCPVKRLKLKIIIAGEAGAGKSFLAKTTDVCYPTREIGVSIGKISETIRDTAFEMTLLTWTVTTGRPKESTHLRHADAAIIVCDLTRPDTVDISFEWANRILKIAGEIPIYFTANNASLKTKDTLNRLKNIASKFDSPCFPIKNRDRKSARRVFRAIAQGLFARYDQKISLPKGQEKGIRG
jgi:signal recognition particle receptor subunit beta